MKFSKHISFSEIAKTKDIHIEGVYTDENCEYIIEKHKIIDNHPFEYRLAIKRADKGTIHSWSIFQEIKNQLVGEEVVAIEVYPKKSEVTDTANMYHLWVFEAGYSPKVLLVPPESNNA